MQRLCFFFNHHLLPVCFIFLLFCFVSLFLTLDIFSGTHVRTCVQVATPLRLCQAQSKRNQTERRVTFKAGFH